MKKILIGLFAFLFFFAHAAQGVVPQKWEVRSKDDFLKGKFEGISVSFDGILSLSPREEKIEGPSEEFYLSILFTSEKVAYLGTGHEGKIYRIGKDGSSELYFQAPEMDVTCLALDKKGNLFAGTSPNGKIYKITAKNKGDMFFNPNEKYIWDLLFTEEGALLVAVGESGGIYEINQEGGGRLVLKAEQNHILCLRMDRNGDFLAGTGGNGLLYRLSKAGKVSVLFESPYEEIKSIALDAEGNIYAAAGGTVTKARKEEIAQTPTISTITEAEIMVTPSRISTEAGQMAASLQKEPGALYRIEASGMTKRLWTSSEELIYTLLWNEGDRKIVFGTGNKGRIYAIDKDEKTSLLIQKSSEQVYSLLSYDSNIYVISNNPPRLDLLYPEQRSAGEYLSSVLDARTISSWGKISWEADLSLGVTLQFQTRSGNLAEPNQSWSDWSPPYQKKEGEQILSPKARYVQFRALFKTQSGKTSPLLQKVALFYLQTNVAPAISELELLAANEVFLKPLEQEEVIWGIERSVSEQEIKKEEAKTVTIAKKVERKGFQTVTWKADDENEDSLSYTITLKKEGEKEWRVLEERWPDTLFAFDTVSFPDGIYFIKIVASDLPSNPQGSELRTEKTSQPLTIDNSAPLIKNFLAQRDKDRLDVTFQAEDSFSYIKEVKYLVRPDDWRVVFPEDRICDSKQESFKIRVNLSLKSDNLITLRVKDSQGNIGVYRQSF